MEILNINENSDVLILNSENFSAVLEDITKGKTSLVCDQTYSVLNLKCSFKAIEILPNKIYWGFPPTILVKCYESTFIPITCLFLIFTKIFLAHCM